MKKKILIVALALLPATILFNSCEQSAEVDATAEMNNEEEANEQIVRDFIDAFNARDMDKGVSNISDNFVYHGEPEFRGKQGYRDFLNMWLTAFPDARMNLKHVVADDDMVAYHLEGTGTHQGDLMGMPPTNKSITMSSMGFMRIENGEIVEEWENFDEMGMMQQLGMMQEPGHMADTTTAGGAPMDNAKAKPKTY